MFLETLFLFTAAHGVARSFASAVTHERSLYDPMPSVTRPPESRPPTPTGGAASLSGRWRITYRDGRTSKTFDVDAPTEALALQRYLAAGGAPDKIINVEAM